MFLFLVGITPELQRHMSDAILDIIRRTAILSR
jgi:hypothetical protein